MCEEACDALANLAAGEAGLRALSAEGGIELLRATSRAHPSLSSAAEVLAALEK